MAEYATFSGIARRLTAKKSPCRWQSAALCRQHRISAGRDPRGPARQDRLPISSAPRHHRISGSRQRHWSTPAASITRVALPPIELAAAYVFTGANSPTVLSCFLFSFIFNGVLLIVHWVCTCHYSFSREPRDSPSRRLHCDVVSRCAGLNRASPVLIRVLLLPYFLAACMQDNPYTDIRATTPLGSAVVQHNQRHRHDPTPGFNHGNVEVGSLDACWKRSRFQATMRKSWTTVSLCGTI
jgi:hypothetical protein